MTVLKTMELVAAGEALRRRATPRILGLLSAGVAAAALRAVGEWTGAPGPTTLGAVGSVALWLVAGAAFMRLAFADEHPDDPDFRPGPQGFQWTRQEWRYLGAAFVTVAAMVLAVVVPVLVCLVLATPLGLTQDPPSQPARAVVAIGLMVGVAIGAFVGVRLSLSAAASIAERRLTFPWSLTRGGFWALLAAYLLIVLGAGLATFAVDRLLKLVAAGALSEAPHEMAVGNFVSALLVLFVQLPMGAGVAAFAYKRLKATAAG